MIRTQTFFTGEYKIRKLIIFYKQNENVKTVFGDGEKYIFLTKIINEKRPLKLLLQLKYTRSLRSKFRVSSFEVLVLFAHME